MCVGTRWSFGWFVAGLACAGAIDLLHRPGAAGAQDSALVAGQGRFAFDGGGHEIEVFTYLPERFVPDRARVLLVFHGVARNAEEYRDWAVPLANATGAVVATPKFDRERYPNTKYQQGNLLADGRVVPEQEWTWTVVPRVAAEVRRRIGRPDAPFDCIGHSAGGQFLVRSAGFVDTGAERIVAANPGTQLFPTRDFDYPLGFGGLPEELGGDDAIRRYLARPLTLYLGSGDTVADRNFDTSAESMRQGASRYERGRNAFALARDLAARRGWPLHWRLVEAEGVGHVAAVMFADPAALRALGDGDPRPGAVRPAR